MTKLKEFILSKKPHVIALSAETRDATYVLEDIKLIVSELEQEEQITPINVELMDNEVAMIFENSSKVQVSEGLHSICTPLHFFLFLVHSIVSKNVQQPSLTIILADILQEIGS
jgi:hypothetical protein